VGVPDEAGAIIPTPFNCTVTSDAHGNLQVTWNIE
jgi:hypothetical protein